MWEEETNKRMERWKQEKAIQCIKAESILRLEVKTVFKTNAKIFLYTKIHHIKQLSC